jgi:hypothetical protein
LCFSNFLAKKIVKIFKWKICLTYELFSAFYYFFEAIVFFICGSTSKSYLWSQNLNCASGWNFHKTINGHSIQMPINSTS